MVYWTILSMTVSSSFPVNQMEWKAQQTTVGSFYLSPGRVTLYNHCTYVVSTHTEQLTVI